MQEPIDYAARVRAAAALVPPQAGRRARLLAGVNGVALARAADTERCWPSTAKPINAEKEAAA
jgi:hypothetical protein